MNRHAEKYGSKWRGKLIHVSGFVDFLSDQVQEICAPADLIIFQRNVLDPMLLDAIRYWQGMGKPVVIDLDDAYHILPYSNPAREFWHEKEFTAPDGETKKGGAFEMLEEGLRVSNGLIAPNRLLLGGLQYAAGNTYYIQNYAEPGWWTDLPDRATLKAERGFEDKIIIGWGGSMSHYDSWWGSGLRTAAERIARRHNDVVFLVCGNDRRIYEQLDVSKNNKAHQGGVPPELWPRTVAGFDIGVAPLAGFYDQHRSWIKGIEYMLGAVPWVGAAGEVYGDLDGIGTTVLVPENADAWEEALENKISNLSQEQERALAFVPEARELFLIDSNLDKLEQVYKQIIADFDPHALVWPVPGIIEIGTGVLPSGEAKK